MREVIQSIYTFDELRDRAKQKARDWYREDFEFDSDYYVEDFERIAAILGIAFNGEAVKLMGGGTRTRPAIMWSGFFCQGDGAMFAGTYRYAKGASKAIRDYAPADDKLHAIADELQAIQRKCFYRLEAKTFRGSFAGNYCHSGCMDIMAYDASTGNETAATEAAERDLRDVLRLFADWMWWTLREGYMAETEDEAVDENIEANGYEFEADGSFHPGH